MSILSIRLPDDRHARLRHLARHRDMSVNNLIEELATISLAEFDAEIRFRSLAAQGSAKKGLAVLDKLDKAFRPRRSLMEIITTPLSMNACSLVLTTESLSSPNESKRTHSVACQSYQNQCGWSARRKLGCYGATLTME